MLRFYPPKSMALETEPEVLQHVSILCQPALGLRFVMADKIARLFLFRSFDEVANSAGYWVPLSGLCVAR